MAKNKDVKTKQKVSPRVAELVDHFASMTPDDALKQIAILPYYHQLENEITKPNQGVFTTRYFVTTWRPALGSEAASIVLALWKPFTTMKEIRNASYGRSDMLNTTLRLWWFFWLALLCTNTVITLIYENSSSPETLSIAEKLHTVSSPIRIILAYLAISMVFGITRAQNQRISQWRN